MTRSRLQESEPLPTSARRRQGFLALICGALALVAVFVWSEARTQGDSPARTGIMPTSPAIEDRHGVRLLGAHLTAAGGMVQIQYQIIDAAKAESIHDEGVSPVLDVRGIRFDTPGMVGHGHSTAKPVAGRTGYVLLANSLNLLHVGDQVSIVVGELSLGGVILE